MATYLYLLRQQLLSYRLNIPARLTGRRNVPPFLIIITSTGGLSRSTPRGQLVVGSWQLDFFSSLSFYQEQIQTTMLHHRSEKFLSYDILFFSFACCQCADITGISYLPLPSPPSPPSFDTPPPYCRGVRLGWTGLALVYYTKINSVFFVPPLPLTLTAFLINRLFIQPAAFSSALASWRLSSVARPRLS